MLSTASEGWGHPGSAVPGHSRHRDDSHRHPRIITMCMYIQYPPSEDSLVDATPVPHRIPVRVLDDAGEAVREERVGRRGGRVPRADRRAVRLAVDFVGVAPHVGRRRRRRGEVGLDAQERPEVEERLRGRLCGNRTSRRLRLSTPSTRRLLEPCGSLSTVDVAG